MSYLMRILVVTSYAMPSIAEKKVFKYLVRAELVLFRTKATRGTDQQNLVNHGLL